jgi:hypothetical protein
LTPTAAAVTQLTINNDRSLASSKTFLIVEADQTVMEQETNGLLVALVLPI